MGQNQNSQTRYIPWLAQKMEKEKLKLERAYNSTDDEEQHANEFLKIYAWKKKY